MSMNRFLGGLGAASILALVSCNSLDVANNNAPDESRALADPATVEAIAGGGFRTFFNSWESLNSAGVLSAQARSYSSSWNNGNLNFYSSIDIGPTDETTSPTLWTRGTRAWQNDPSAVARISVDAFWGGSQDQGAPSVFRPGFYTSLSSANDALRAIRTNGLVIFNAAGTKRAETMAVLIQGMSLAGISLNFDKGYIVDETTNVLTVQYSDRKAMRDAAVAKLNEAAALAAANTFTTDAGWTNGYEYSNTQIAQIAKTMVAYTLMYYPRDDAEVAAMTTAEWQAIYNAAAAGMSSTSPFTLQFDGDGCVAWCPELLAWFNEYSTGRVNTRVAHFLDPVTQTDPYPLAAGGNARPNSADRRMGDGSFGVASMQGVYGNFPATANAGTDFAWSEAGEVFRPDRGYYHQSNIGQIRYDLTHQQLPTGIGGSVGPSPVINATLNDLIWAEASLRLGGVANIATAVQKINNTRVTRGGLTAAATTDVLGAPSDGPCMSNGQLAKTGAGPCTLWSKLLYENEIELLGLGPSPYFNQRHLPVVTSNGVSGKARIIQGLIPGTPRDMPVPYKELGIKGEPLYSFGGANPAKSTPP